jgi:hypothetical protein
MSSFKQFKTQKLGIALQSTETTAPGMDGRQWEVHDVERGRGFKVSLAERTLHGLAAKSKHQFTEADIESAIGLAIENSLTSPPEKLPGSMYDINVTKDDLARGSKPE